MENINDKMELMEHEFKRILNTNESNYFNIVSRSFLKNDRENYIYKLFNKYRKISERKGSEFLFSYKKYKGIEHIIINIDKESFFSDKNNDIECLELYKNGIIFTEKEFFVF